MWSDFSFRSIAGNHFVLHSSVTVALTLDTKSFFLSVQKAAVEIRLQTQKPEISFWLAGVVSQLHKIEAVVWLVVEPTNVQLWCSFSDTLKRQEWSWLKTSPCNSNSSAIITKAEGRNQVASHTNYVFLRRIPCNVKYLLPKLMWKELHRILEWQ